MSKRPPKGRGVMRERSLDLQDRQRQEARRRLMAAKRAASFRQNSATERADSIEIYIPEAQTRLWNSHACVQLRPMRFTNRVHPFCSMPVLHPHASDVLHDALPPLAICRELRTVVDFYIQYIYASMQTGHSSTCTARPEATEGRCSF